MKPGISVSATPHLLFFLLIYPLLCAELAQADGFGLFADQVDIGKPSQAGTAVFDSANGSYTVGGGGENMWFTNDSFHFVWKRVSGDFALTAAFDWLASGGNAHRKGCLMVRQDLRPESAYVDVAIHGDGLTSMQFRETAGGLTHEIQANVKGPALAGIERQGDVFFMSLPNPEKTPATGGSTGVTTSVSGAYMRLKFTDPVYVGLAVCAHDDKVLEQGRFVNVQLQSKEAIAGRKPMLHCTLESIAIASKDRRAIYHTTNHIEAPNWSRDGRFFLYNSSGHLHRLPVGGGEPELVPTGFANRCNNDHGYSPDGSLMAISDQSRGGKSLIYVLPAAGGEPRPITSQAPSYWHGWSPDGLTLAYCAERNGEFDIYSVPVEGGVEKRLTTAKGLDDGPDYTSDGKWIYFNSDRSGTMQVWRMKPDGSEQTQVTSDEFNNWFPHPSPDNKWLVFLSYQKEVTGHPENQPVRLRLMPIGGGVIRELAQLFGGQGTINVPSWAPDGRQLAFVSYELIQERR
jgi:hypothetical protein